MTASTPPPAHRITTEMREFQFETVFVDDTAIVIEKKPLKGQMAVLTLAPGVELEMVAIPGGTFQMGSPESEIGRYKDEGPLRQVKVYPFFCSRYQITQPQWRVVASWPAVNMQLEAEPSRIPGENRPVETIDWAMAVEFCDRLTVALGQPHRLPSEAEWEYACRAGSTSPFHYGPTISTELANVNGDRAYANGPEGEERETTTDVGTFPPNAFGLHDMHGNVKEWCADPWHVDYRGAPADSRVWDVNPIGETRLQRGGDWNYFARDARSARRDRNEANYYGKDVGFRIVMPTRQL